MYLRLAWQVWHLWHWAGSGGVLGRRVSHSPGAPRHFAWRAWHSAALTPHLRGSRGTWWHLPAFGVAGVALVSLVARLVAVSRLERHGTLRGRHGAWWHRRSICVASLALGDIDVPFAWQAWHLATCTCVWSGRRGTCGTCGTGLALMARLVAALVTRPGRRGSLRGRRGAWWHRRSICVAGVALVLTSTFGLAWQAWRLAKCTLRLAWQVCALGGYCGWLCEMACLVQIALVTRPGQNRGTFAWQTLALGDIDVPFAPGRRDHLVNIQTCVRWRGIFCGTCVIGNGCWWRAWSLLRLPLFRHLIFTDCVWNCGKTWSRFLLTFWQGAQCASRLPPASTFSTSEHRKVLRRMVNVLYILNWKCASRHNGRALFRHLNFQKSFRELGVFCTFWLGHNGVRLFISQLTTCRFGEPTFRPSAATNHWTNVVFGDFPAFSRASLFLFSSPLWPASAFPSVHIVGSLTSKLPSVISYHIWFHLVRSYYLTTNCYLVYLSCLDISYAIKPCYFSSYHIFSYVTITCYILSYLLTSHNPLSYLIYISVNIISYHFGSCRILSYLVVSFHIFQIFFTLSYLMISHKMLLFPRIFYYIVLYP